MLHQLSAKVVTTPILSSLLAESESSSSPNENVLRKLSQDYNPLSAPPFSLSSSLTLPFSSHNMEPDPDSRISLTEHIRAGLHPAGLMRNLGPHTLSTPAMFKGFLSTVNLNEDTVSVMVMTLLTSADPNFSDSPHQPWNLEIFVNGINQAKPTLQWVKVMKKLDSPSFLLPSIQSVQTLFQMYMLAMNQTFPVFDVVLSANWSNLASQVCLLLFIFSSLSFVEKHSFYTSFFFVFPSHAFFRSDSFTFSFISPMSPIALKTPQHNSPLSIVLAISKSESHACYAGTLWILSSD